MRVWPIGNFRDPIGTAMSHGDRDGSNSCNSWADQHRCAERGGSGCKPRARRCWRRERRTRLRRADSPVSTPVYKISSRAVHRRSGSGMTWVWRPAGLAIAAVAAPPLRLASGRPRHGSHDPYWFHRCALDGRFARIRQARIPAGQVRRAARPDGARVPARPVEFVGWEVRARRVPRACHAAR